MKIRYFGHSHFYIEGDNYSIVLDPFKGVGLKEFSVKSDYVFSSHNHFDHNNISLAVGAKAVKNQPPFEIVKTYHDEKNGALRGGNDVLVFELDGVKLAFLGDLGEYSNNEVLNKIKGVDVLFVPIGGKYTIDDAGAYEYAVKSHAKAVVPMHYKIKGSTVDVKGLKPFLDKFSSYIEVKSPYNYNRESGIIVIVPEQEV